VATLNTLLPNGTLVVSPILGSGAYTDIDEGFAGGGPDGAYVQTYINWTGYVNCPVTDTPVDFVSMITLTYNIRYNLLACVDDTDVLYVQVFKANGSTALTDKMTVASTPATGFTNKGNTSFTGVDTAATKTEWDAALLKISGLHTSTMSADNTSWRFDTVELNGTYTPAISSRGRSPMMVKPTHVPPYSSFYFGG
jgi:hypothetical protein